MLVLSRRENESIYIGDDIKIMVVEFKNGKVRLGIEAPKDIPVMREEVRERILLERSKSNGEKDN